MSHNYYFQTASICLNGHIRNTATEEEIVKNENYCTLCGSKTISRCLICNNPIRGNYCYNEPIYEYTYDPFYENSEELLTGHNKICINTPAEAPAFCYHCGSPYPWTKTLLKAGEDIVDLLDELSDTQKQQLKNTFPDLISENPRSQISALIAAKLTNALEDTGKYFLITWFENNILPQLFTLMNLTR